MHSEGRVRTFAPDENFVAVRHRDPSKVKVFDFQSLRVPLWKLSPMTLAHIAKVSIVSKDRKGSVFVIHATLNVSSLISRDVRFSAYPFG